MRIGRTCKRKMFDDKRATSYVTSAVTLTGVAITLGLVVLAWTQSKSSNFTDQYSETMDAETAKLGERLAAEYAVYMKAKFGFTFSTGGRWMMWKYRLLCSERVHGI